MLLKRMLARMIPRGPDGEGIWTDAHVGLGHRLLRSTPESIHEHQPFVGGRDPRVIVFDGRIDNRRELKAQLFREGEKSDSLPDVEYVLAGYEAWGEALPRHLVGDFAFAIWDPRNRRLFLARDPLGVKPLYYHWDGRRFVFGSEVAPFFEDPSVPNHPDERTIADYLYGGFRDREETFFQGIRQLPPAHFLCFEPNRGPRLERYWDFGFNERPGSKNPEEYYEGFREIFEKAVRARMRTPSPAGLLLSGGLDSTQIAATIETLRRRGEDLPCLKTVTLLNGCFLREEWEAIELLQKTFGIKTEMLRLESEEDLKSSFEYYLNSGETPESNGFPTLPALLKPLRLEGCGVALTGFGANELVYQAEFGYLEDLLLSFRFRDFSREVRRMGEATLSHPGSLTALLLDEALRKKAPYFVRWAARQWNIRALRWTGRKLRRNISRRPLPRRPGFSTLCRENVRQVLGAPSFTFELNQIDFLAARFSMEIRHPFLDRRLIEFYLAVPDPIKMESGYRKSFVQRALRGLVPGAPREKEDSRFLMPKPENERQRQIETGRLRHYLADRGARIYQYVQYSKVEKMRRLNQKDWQLSLSFLWRLAILESWFETYFPQARKKTEVPHERYSSSLLAG